MSNLSPRIRFLLENFQERLEDLKEHEEERSPNLGFHRKNFQDSVYGSSRDLSFEHLLNDVGGDLVELEYQAGKVLEAISHPKVNDHTSQDFRERLAAWVDAQKSLQAAQSMLPEGLSEFLLKMSGNLKGDSWTANSKQQLELLKSMIEEVHRKVASEN